MRFIFLKLTVPLKNPINLLTSSLIINQMDTIECILTRRSIRKYKEIPVEWDKVATILEAGRAAPSAGNLQNWKFIVVMDSDKRKKIAHACLNQDWMIQAPVHIVICSEPDKAKRFYGLRGERLYSIQNCAAVAQNMLLAAHALGLGACWVGAFDEDLIGSLINLPSNITMRPQVIITIGYADEKPPAPAKFTLWNVAYLEKWWGRIKDVDSTLGYFSPKVMKTIDKGREILSKINEKLMKRDNDNK
jgi:nitroreductase